MLRRALVLRLRVLNHNLQNGYVARQATTYSEKPPSSRKVEVPQRTKEVIKKADRKNPKKGNVRENLLTEQRPAKTKKAAEDVINKIIEQANKMAADRYESLATRDVAKSAASYLTNHHFSRKHYTDHDIRLLEFQTHENGDNHKLVKAMARYNNHVGALLEACHFSGEKATKLFYIVQRLRSDSARQRALVTGEILYSVPRVYNVLLNALAKEGQSELSLRILDWLHEDGLKPDYNSYLYILESMGRPQSKADIIEISQLMKRMRDDEYPIEELFWRGQFDPDGLHCTLKAILQALPDFRPRTLRQFMDRSSEHEEFPVLQQCLSAKISSNNPYYGVETSEDMMRNFQRQLDVEMYGGKKVQPIHDYEAHPVPAERQRLALAYREEQERWRIRLSDAFDVIVKVEKDKNFVSSVYPFLTLMPKSTYVDLMMQEIDFMTAAGSHDYRSAFSMFMEMGRRVQNAYKVEVRKRYGLLDKFRTVYQAYINEYTAEKRSPDILYLSDVWWNCCAANLNGASLEPRSTDWEMNILIRVGKTLFKLMYENMLFNVNAIRGDELDRKESPVIYEALQNDGITTREVIQVHPKLIRWNELAGLVELRFAPNQLPMLCPPMPWVRPEVKKTAGYFFEFNKTELVRKPNITTTMQWDYSDKLVRKELYPTLDAINALNAVPWRVNKPVLEVMLKIFRDGGDPKKLRQIGLPVAKEDLPEIPVVSSNLSMSERNKMKFAQLDMIKRHKENYSNWVDMMYRFSIANAYKDDVIYFPQTMDFRGRVYPCSPYFQHMGSDISRGMLVFAKGKPLGSEGLNWMLIHIVNLTGFLKRSSNADRLAFGKEHLPDILDSAEEPLTGRGWWRDSEEPWQTLACCMEVAKALKSPNHEEFISHIPIHQDGSCNGLQHYAALGRDRNGAECVNLIDRHKPKDVYSDVVEYVESRRQQDAAKGVSIAQKLEGYVERKIIKQSVMTTVYGVTMYGAKAQVARQLRDLPDFPPEDIPEASVYLAKLTLDSIGIFFTASVDFQKWLTSCARLIAIYRNSLINWKTPLGLYVLQPYVKKGQPQYNILKTFPDIQKQKRAMPPNFIHSIDSSHMMLTALQCHREGLTFAAVHDSFWTHAADVGEMNLICRQQFVALHEQPLIRNLSDWLYDQFAFSDKEMEEIVPRTLKDGHVFDRNYAKLFNKRLRDSPQVGNFDLHEIMKSTYFFS